MREILFRGKRIDNGEWIEGYLLKVCNYATCSWDLSIEYKDPQWSGSKAYNTAAVDPSTICQFTGLTDKNGKKIFEGDVLRFNYTGKNHGVDGKATVIFEHGKFGVLWGWHKEFVCLDGFANTTIEVIGNIHDNHELLENP